MFLKPKLLFIAAIGSLVGAVLLIVALGVARSGLTDVRAAPVLDCGDSRGTLQADDVAQVYLDPTSGSANDGFSAFISGAQSALNDQEVEVIWDFNLPAAQVVGEGIIPGDTGSSTVLSTVPFDASEGYHDVRVCWLNGSQETWYYVDLFFGYFVNPVHKTITSDGPLEAIYLGDDLQCQIKHTSDVDLEFYPPETVPGDCGTFAAVNGVLYAPDFGEDTATGFGTYTPFTPVSQSDVSGSGTAADPYLVETVVGLGDTNLTIKQTDSYVVGQEAYRTDVEISNTGDGGEDVILYRAADCYLGGSDSGYGWVDAPTRAVACSINANNDPAGRIEQWLPLTGGNNYFHSGYSTVWDVIGSKVPFDDTCLCDTLLDNGAGISWSLTLPGGTSTTRSHLTTFSPLGTLPLTMTKTADDATTPAGGVNGYTITINNPNAGAINVD